jgi:hypothetical protein
VTEQITVTMIGRGDEEPPVVDFKTRTWMCQADRVAFERRFHTSIGAMSKLRDQFDPETNEPKEGADLSILKEEHIAFFAWRCMNREVQDQGSFEDWLEKVAEVDVVDLSAPAPKNGEASGPENGEAEPGSAPAEPPAEAERPTVPLTA